MAKKESRDRTFERHMKAIKSGTIDKTTVIGMRKALNAIEKADRFGGSWANPKGMTAEQVCELHIAIQHIKPMIAKDSDLHKSGVKVLQSKRYRKRIAQTALASEIVATIERFELVDFEMYDDVHFTPVYRVTGANGNRFRFRNVPWQAGGNGPEVV